MNLQAGIPQVESREDLARVLALLVAAKGHVDDSEWRALESDDAWQRIGVGLTRFTELVDHCTQEIGTDLREHAWLSETSLTRVDLALAEITDLDERLLVCQLATRALQAGNPQVGHDTLLLDHTLARWHLGGAMLGQRPSPDARRAG